jgi:hypothetical protein
LAEVKDGVKDKSNNKSLPGTDSVFLDKTKAVAVDLEGIFYDHN